MKRIDSVSRELWHGTAAACTWAVFFHTPLWADCMAGAVPGCRPACLGFELEDGTPALLPAVARSKKRLLTTGTEYRSTEPGTYGGFIAPRTLTPQECRAMGRLLLDAKKTGGRIVETPGMPLGLEAPFRAKKMTTHVVDLTEGYDQVRKNFNRGQKSNINQAIKKGVSVRQAQNAADIEAYCRIYRRTLERWGDSAAAAYPDTLFERLFEHRDAGIAFWLAEADSTVIAGILVLSWNNLAVYWHGCALKEYFRHYPNNLLHARVMEWACEKGFHTYDMGASIGIEGVRRFKESFGARGVEYTAYRWK